MEIHIRKARSDDQPAIVEMMDSQLRDTYGHFMPADYLDAWLDGGETDQCIGRMMDHIVVAEREGALVGMASIDDAMLGLIWISAPSRGSGVGTSLMAYVEQVWREAGHTVGQLECWPVNTRALAFYESLGWQVVSVRPDPDAPRLDKALMAKTLDAT